MIYMILNFFCIRSRNLLRMFCNMWLLSFKFPGKEKCFERITSRFEKTKCTYVVIGDGQEEETVAKQVCNFLIYDQNYI